MKSYDDMKKAPDGVYIEVFEDRGCETPISICIGPYSDVEEARTAMSTASFPGKPRIVKFITREKT